MNLHFVCTGNVFRSRLAESYARYLLKNHPHFKVNSSGVNADHAQDGPIAWYALKIIVDNDLLDYLSPTWVQTTSVLLESPDKIIFLQPWHLDQCRTRFGYQKDNYQIWDIADVEGDMSDEEVIEFSQKQFELIKHQVGKLINKLII